MEVIRIGVLSLQGGFIEHVNMLKSINPNTIGNRVIDAKELKSVDQIKQFKPHGLVLPGGESTAMSIIAEKDDLFPYLKSLINVEKLPVWGTCAGSIMLSNSVQGQKEGGQSLIGGLDVHISRNYFGRQINSFETTLQLKLNNKNNTIEEFEGIFIRAPAILKVTSDKVNIIGTFTHQLKPIGADSSTQHETVIIAASQDNILATVFHPELTNDNRFHTYFVNQFILNK